MPLFIDFNDLLRATLEEESGNEGYIGLAPDGGRYHVVVPVDRQIARGVKAGLRSSDETPFGGYTGWHYFCCPGFPRPRDFDRDETERRRRRQARINARRLKAWAAERGIEVEILGSGEKERIG
jgi:hypothetical protein